MNSPKIRYDIEANASGEAEVRSLAEQLEKLDGAVDPAAAESAKQLASELRRLGEASSALKTFERALVDANEASGKLEQSTQALQRMEQRLQSIQSPTRAQAGQLEKLRDAAQRAQTAYTAKTEALSAARGRVQALGVETNDLAVAENRVAAATSAATAQGRALVASYQQQAQAARQSGAEQRQAVDKVEAGLEGISRRLDGLRNIGLAGILGSQTTQLLGSVGEAADAFNNLRARIQLVTGEGPALQQALQGVERIALSTGQSLENTGTLFTRILSAGREVGLAQEDALELTETINRAVAISGASAAASDAAITQFVQALQSGVLRGEEFNSVVEQSPRLAKALADGLGVTTGELRKLANEGKLTTTQLLEALKSQRAVLDREFGQLPVTIGRAVENLQTKWLTFIGSLDGATGASRAVAAGINGLAESLDELGAIAARAGVVLVAALAVQGAGALRSLATQAMATAGTMGVLSKSIADVPKIVNIAVAVTGFELGFQLGDMLRENSELARKFGVGVTEFLVGVVNDLQFLKEAAAAVFTDDTIGAAFDRFKQRAKEQEAIFADLYREAERSPEVVRAAADAAAAATERVGSTAKATAAVLVAEGAAGAAGVSKVTAAADTAQGAIVALADAAGVKLPEGAKRAGQMAAALNDLASKSSEAAQRIGAEIPAALAKLSGAELQRFRDLFISTMTEGARNAGVLQAVLVETGKRAAEALGVDVARAAGTMSEAFVVAQDNLTVLVRSAGALQAAGLDAGNVIAEALRKMAETADVQEEFNALRTRVEALGKAGVLTKEQMTDLLDTIRGKAQQAAEGMSKLTEAYKTLGVQSQAELQRVADKSRQAWELIRNDATASLATKQAAFQRYAEAAIAANNGVATSTVQAEARGLGLAVQADRTGKAIVGAMGTAASAVDRVGERFGEVGRKAGEAAAQVNKFGELLNTSASGIGIGAGLSPSTLPPLSQPRGPGGVATSPVVVGSFQLPPPKAQGNWTFIPDPRVRGGVSVAQAQKGQYASGSHNGQAGLPVQGLGIWVRTDKPEAGEGAAGPFGGPAGASSVGAFGGVAGPVASPAGPSALPVAPSQPVPTPAPSPRVNFDLVRIELAIPGAGTASGFAERGFADGFLSLIESAKRAAGG